LKAAFLKESAAGKFIANRYAFYCAQSYKDSRQIDSAIEWYTMVVEKLQNWNQEKFYSCIMIGNLYAEKNDLDKALVYYLKSVEFDRERIEGIVNACEILRRRNLHQLVVALYFQYKSYNHSPKDKLFLSVDQYADVLEFNVSISSFYSGMHELAYECTKTILKNRIANEGIIRTSLSNLKFYKNFII
jgi:tetratricopeptide (TPR) repeat protein